MRKSRRFEKIAKEAMNKKQIKSKINSRNTESLMKLAEFWLWNAKFIFTSALLSIFYGLFLTLNDDFESGLYIILFCLYSGFIGIITNITISRGILIFDGIYSEIKEMKTMMSK
tara:strand:- start:271 stop:612 length:342 start_codon:yes stop_codon:yes gene_type:complete